VAGHGGRVAGVSVMRRFSQERRALSISPKLAFDWVIPSIRILGSIVIPLNKSAMNFKGRVW
jgi:hypothetical protein